MGKPTKAHSKQTSDHKGPQTMSHNILCEEGTHCSPFSQKLKITRPRKMLRWFILGQNPSKNKSRFLWSFQINYPFLNLERQAGQMAFWAQPFHIPRHRMCLHRARLVELEILSVQKSRNLVFPFRQVPYHMDFEGGVYIHTQKKNIQNSPRKQISSTLSKIRSV